VIIIPSLANQRKLINPIEFTFAKLVNIDDESGLDIDKNDYITFSIVRKGLCVEKDRLEAALSNV